MTVGSNGMLAKQPIVVCMTADPEPDEAVGRFDRKRAVAPSNPSGPEAAELLELKRGMSRILLETRVRLIGELLHL
ncbi:MAG: hypothetical protein HYU51_17370 [Candidatus Rokubacteria bacterium]|nr:hypothetical protein [Candidatus Rokubacteria bacterium]